MDSTYGCKRLRALAVNDIVHLIVETTVNGSVHCVGRKRLHAFYKTVQIRKTVKRAVQWLTGS